MKILIINTDYPGFLKDFYGQNPTLADSSYDKQLALRNDTFFGSADFYSHNLNQVRCQAIDIHYNNVALQSKWAEENLANTSIVWKLKKLIYCITDSRMIKAIGSKLFPSIPFPHKGFLNYVLENQIKFFNPDVILNQTIFEVSHKVFKKYRQGRLMVGQIASPLPSNEELAGYELLVSSLPNFVEKFAKIPVPSAYIKLAFDARVVKNQQHNRDLGVVFVGSITAEHKQRVLLLEYLCERIDLQIWGNLHGLAANSPIHRCYKGEAWGREMYEIFSRAKIVLNNHIDLSGEYANNMRLFEASGSGALLLTDDKKNINELFEVGKEVVTYRSAEECLNRIQYYLVHNDEREMIALKGQKRTLSEHSYLNRMEELSTLFRKYL